jgi:ferritin-like metal-binding protein YciE
MAISALDDLFYETLKDLYFAEKKLVKALPKMIKAASSPNLVDAIKGHLAETSEHVERLEAVFEAIDRKPVAKKCDAIEGLIKEAESVLADIEDDDTMDAAIISSAQTVEHYEIARYGTLVAWAQQLGWGEAANLLQETLDEEKACDAALSQMAESTLNQQAAA